MCVSLGVWVWERVREEGKSNGGAADGYAEQNGLLGAGPTLPSQFRCPRPSPTGHSQGDLPFHHTHRLTNTHTQAHTWRDNATRADRNVTVALMYSRYVQLSCTPRPRPHMPHTPRHRRQKTAEWWQIRSYNFFSIGKSVLRPRFWGEMTHTN